MQLTSSLAVFDKSGEKEKFVAVADSVDTSDAEGGDFMFKSESSIMIVKLRVRNVAVTLFVTLAVATIADANSESIDNYVDDYNETTKRLRM